MKINNKATKKLVLGFIKACKALYMYGYRDKDQREHDTSHGLVLVINDALALVDAPVKERCRNILHNRPRATLTAKEAINLAKAIKDLTGINMLVYTGQDESEITRLLDDQAPELLRAYYNKNVSGH